MSYLSLTSAIFRAVGLHKKPKSTSFGGRGGAAAAVEAAAAAVVLLL